MTAAFSAHSFR